MLLMIVTVYERRSRIKALRKNLGYFSTNKLSTRLVGYSSSVKSNGEIKTITNKINQLIKVEHTKIMEDIVALENSVVLSSFYHYILFNRRFKTLLINVRKFERKYLEKSFQLTDLTTDIQIEQTVLNKLKERTSTVIDSYSNSPLKEIRENKKISNKITRLQKALSALETMIDEQEKHLSVEFTKTISKIDSDIDKISSDIDFMNHNITHLGELEAPTKIIIEAYENNKAVLDTLKGNIFNKAKKIKELRETIPQEIIDLKIKDVNKNMLDLETTISSLNLLVHSNIDFAKFNVKFKNASDSLFEFVNQNHPLFLSEIKRHHTANEEDRLKAIDFAYTDFKNAVTKYERESSSEVEIKVPENVANLILKIIQKYKEYTTTVSENVQDISEVNSTTNKINLEIGMMNTGLLQVEFNISNITGTIKETLEKHKEELQDKLIILRDKFKNNTDEIDDDAFLYSKKLAKQISGLIEETKGITFEIFFLEKTILYLNRWRGKDAKFDKLLKHINDLFLEEKFSESLRNCKEIIEIYGIR